MGPYTPEAYWYEFTGIMTNATPTDAYRGAGRPEATFVIERLVDAFARRIGKDPAEVRRMNLHPPFDEATPSIMGLSLDSGNFEPTFDRALELAEYERYRKEQAARRDAGDVRQIGIGLSSYIEMCGLAPSNILGALRYVAGGWDAAEVECRPDGRVVVRTGTSPHGQGHATSWSQIVADGLGVTPDDVDVLHGDTAVSKMGMDTYGSRSAAVGGEALRRAVERVREKASLIAAHELEVSQDDLEWIDGAFRVRGAPDKARTIAELAGSAWHAHDLPAGVEPMLEGTAVFDPPNFTWPAGTHVCVVEVDTETGSHGHPPIRGVGRLRQRDQPDDRGRDGARRRRARDRGGAVRGSGLRRSRQPDVVLDDAVPGAVCRGDARVHPRSNGHAVDDQRARGEGDR